MTDNPTKAMKPLLCLALFLAAACHAPAGCLPTLSCVPDKTVSCASPWDFDTPTIVTNYCNDCCSCLTNNLPLLILGTVTNGTACSNSITRTWGVVSCGIITNTCSQTVTVLHTNKPVFQAVNPGPIVFYTCTNSAVVLYALDASAACGGCSLNLTYDPTNGSSVLLGHTQNVTCVATDCCGNWSSTNFLVTVQLLPLELYCSPKTVTNGTAWTFDTPYIQLGCCTNAGYTLTNLTPVTNPTCPQIITTTWVITDACGHTTNCTETVTVVGPPAFPPATGDYLVNGSFEQPALAGNGDRFSTDPGFALPGWFYPSGSNQFFLEYGVPASAGPRYRDGRQAVCLNGQGTPVSASQTFPTLPGQNYTLSFWQSDASNAAPSLSELTVSVAALTRVFSRTNDTGYVWKRWHFTADAYCTTIVFTDTTPPDNPSPFLDAVCVNPGGFPVAGNDTRIPNGHGGWEDFPTGPSLIYPGVDSGVVFLALGADSQAGIYRQLPQADFMVIADLHHPIPPNGSVPFATFSGTSGRAGMPSSSMGLVAFWGADASGNDGIYDGDGVQPLQVVADTHTAIPGGAGNFTAFTGSLAYPGDPYISGQTVVFHGYGSSGQQGVYAGYPSGPIRVVADTHTAIPGGSGNFTTFTTSAGIPAAGGVDGNQVVFWAEGASGQQGIYRFASDPAFPGSPIKIADLATFMPGGTGNFTDFVGNATAPVGPVIYDNNIAFRGAGAGGRIGIYAMINGMLAKVADTTTPVTGGMGMFVDFQAVSLSGDVVAFAATGPGGQLGIYMSFPNAPVRSFPNTPVKVIDLNDTLDGKTLTGLLLGPGGLSGDALAFAAAFSDGSQGIYTIPVVAETEITSAVRAGPDLQLTYTAPAGYNYSVQSRTDLVTGAWTTLPGTDYGNGSLLQTTVTNPFAVPRQFYRVQQSH